MTRFDVNIADMIAPEQPSERVSFIYACLTEQKRLPDRGNMTELGYGVVYDYLMDSGHLSDAQMAKIPMTLRHYTEGTAADIALLHNIICRNPDKLYATVIDWLWTSGVVNPSSNIFEQIATDAPLNKDSIIVYCTF